MKVPGGQAGEGGKHPGHVGCEVPNRSCLYEDLPYCGRRDAMASCFLSWVIDRAGRAGAPSDSVLTGAPFEYELGRLLLSHR
jgi:hypothetical protein